MVHIYLRSVRDVLREAAHELIALATGWPR